MTTEIASEAIGLTLDRPVEVGRFVFARSGGSYRFTMEPVRDGFEVCAEWCEPGELEPSQIHTPGIYVQRVIKGNFEKRIERRMVRQG